MTCQLLLYHSTKPKNRKSIEIYGLTPHTPSIDGNYPHLPEQPRGIYLFSPHIHGEDTDDYPDRFGLWSRQYDYKSLTNDDLWEVPYFGPLELDPMVENSVIATLENRVKPSRLVPEGEEPAD